MEDLILVGILFVALLLIVGVIVVLSRINALYKNGHDNVFICPKCGHDRYLLVFDTGDGTLHPKDYKTIPGLFRCANCFIMYKRYGNGPLIEVFGTPVDKEGGNHD